MAVLTAIFAVARPVRAEAPPVSLDLGDCERLDEAAVRRIFAADLGTSVATEANPYITEVTISCDGARVIVRVRDPLSRKTLRRAFDSTSFGDRGEARLVAIAASELVMASWAELAANPAPEVEPEGPAPTRQTIETARAAVRAHRGPVKNLDSGDITVAKLEAAEPTEKLQPLLPENPAGGPRSAAAAPTEGAAERRRQREAEEADPTVLRVVGLASMRSFFGGDGTLVGGGARVGQELPPLTSWAIDALVESGELHGTRVTSATVGGLLQAYLRYQRLITWRAGFGLRAGLLGSEGGPYVGAFGWPLATTSVSLVLNRFAFDVSGEVGYGILPMSGGARPAVRGWWAGGQVGIGLTL